MLARHYPGLVRDWPPEDQGVETYARFSKNAFQLYGFAIVSQRRHELSLNTQACEVRCDVGCSPGSLPFALNFNQRDRGFVGNAHGIAFEIAIQNQIANDEQLDAGETADDLRKPVFVDLQSNLFLNATAWIVWRVSQTRRIAPASPESPIGNAERCGDTLRLFRNSIMLGYP